MEKTVVLIKPDALHRAIIGDIIMRIERKGLKLAGMKMMTLTEDLIAEHYSHLLDKPFFAEIKRFMTSLPIVAICVEGVDAIDAVRQLTGITLARKAEPGTIRGDLAMSVQCNLVHASDSAETAAAELERFFRKEEIHEYERLIDSVVYSSAERLIK